MSSNEIEEIEPEITVYWDEELKCWGAFQGEVSDIIYLAPTKRKAFEDCLEASEEAERKKKYTESGVRREALRNVGFNMVNNDHKSDSLSSWLYRQREGEFFRNRKPSLQEVSDWLIWLSSRS